MPFKLMIFLCKALPFSFFFFFFFSFLAEAGQVVQPFAATNGACKWTSRHLVSALALHSYTFKPPGNKINSQVIRCCCNSSEKTKKERKEKTNSISRKVEEIVFSNPVVVFSKTYCGYCKRLKQLFTELGAVYKVIELDEESDGREMQQALAEWTRQGTVPNVFVAGKHVGGSDAVVAKYEAGELLHLLVAAGAMPNMQL